MAKARPATKERAQLVLKEAQLVKSRAQLRSMVAKPQACLSLSTSSKSSSRSRRAIRTVRCRSRSCLSSLVSTRPTSFSVMRLSVKSSTLSLVRLSFPRFLILSLVSATRKCPSSSPKCSTIATTSLSRLATRCLRKTRRRGRRKAQVKQLTLDQMLPARRVSLLVEMTPKPSRLRSPIHSSRVPTISSSKTCRKRRRLPAA